MEWVTTATLAVSSYDSEPIESLFPISSPLLRVKGINNDSACAGVPKMGVLRLLTLTGDTILEVIVNQSSVIVEIPRWLESFIPVFHPEPYLNSAQVVLDRAENVIYQEYDPNIMATLRQVIDNTNNVAALQADLDIAEAQLDNLDSSAARQVDVTFGDILSADATYNFSHVILSHNLSDSFPTVAFYNADSQPELLEWGIVDSNNIVVNITGASSLPNASWRAVITGKAESIGD